jgi:hypothetical protein
MLLPESSSSDEELPGKPKKPKVKKAPKPKKPSAKKVAKQVSNHI